MTMRIRAAMLLLVGLACACAAWAQGALPAGNAPADPKVWGVYATLAGQERQQEGKTGTYLMRWRWLEPGAQLREEYVVPSTGKLAHYNTITPGATPGTLHLKASYMGGKEWNGTLDADGTVHWVGKGFFKLSYSVGPGPDGALLYGMEGQEPMRLVRMDAGAEAPAVAANTTQAVMAQATPAPATVAPPAGATATAEQHAANAAALEAQARDLRALEASALAQRRAAEAAGQATLAALQAEVQVKAAAAAAEVEAQARVQAQLAGSATPAQGQVGAAPAAVVAATGGDVAMPSVAGSAENNAPVATPAPAATLATAPAPVRAASPTDGFTPGTYILDGGSYVIEVQRDGDGLLVVEPNKRSPYSWSAGRDFHFYNPNTDTTYGIRVVDARTIEAFKPFVDGNVPSRLTLLSAAASDTPQEDLGDPGYEAIAEKYAAMIETDPANVQSWTACAAAAMKYGIATREEADAYARQMIDILRLMDAQSTPCEDALPSRLW